MYHLSINSSINDYFLKEAHARRCVDFIQKYLCTYIETNSYLKYYGIVGSQEQETIGCINVSIIYSTKILLFMAQKGLNKFMYVATLCVSPTLSCNNIKYKN